MNTRGLSNDRLISCVKTCNRKEYVSVGQVLRLRCPERTRAEDISLTQPHQCDKDRADLYALLPGNTSPGHPNDQYLSPRQQTLSARAYCFARIIHIDEHAAYFCLYANLADARNRKSALLRLIRLDSGKTSLFPSLNAVLQNRDVCEAHVVQQLDTQRPQRASSTGRNDGT